jgi:hypothetical protein
MEFFYIRKCINIKCGKIYKPKNSTQKYCVICGKENNMRINRESQAKFRKKKDIIK